jgi:hypothetical protein
MEAATEIEVVPPTPLPTKALAKPTTPRAIVMAEALKEDTEQRVLLQAYVREHMKEGTDFGVIPGTQKPTLLKPGAEKLTDLFRCTPTFDLLEKLEDWDKGLFHYTFRVRITSRDAGTVLAEGFGSANSREGRYRWRDSRRKCPNCGKEAIIKGKAEYGGGWVCFHKKGGCGAKWEDGATEIESQETGKVENDDVFTLVNTILKMAKKRALVDGAIALARCSDIFTQDVEDFAEEGHAEAPRAASRPAPRRDAPRKVEAAPVDAARNVTVAAEVLGGKVETPPAKRGAPPPHVLALWNKVVEANGEKKKAKAPLSHAAFERGAASVFGDKPKPSTDWTSEDAKAVEAAIFPDDIPF